MESNELVRLVREHALRNYEVGNWDIIVECWSDEDIAHEIADATTFEEAVERCKPKTSLQAERLRDLTFMTRTSNIDVIDE